MLRANVTDIVTIISVHLLQADIQAAAFATYPGCCHLDI